MTLSSIVNTLRSRWIVFVFTLVSVVAVGLVALMMIPDRYTATAAMVFGGSADPMRSPALPGSNTVYLTTQVEILRSDRIASAIAARLTGPSRTLLESFWRLSKAELPFESWAAGFIKRGSSVQFSRESNVVQVSFTSSDPRLSADIANGMVDRFIETAVDIRGQAAEEYQSSYERQTRQARTRLQEAQDALSKYQSEHRSLATNAGLDSEVRRLAELSDRVATLRAAAEQARITAREAKNRDRPAGASSDAVWVGLLAQQQAAQAEIAAASQQLGPSHPRVRELNSRLAAVREQMRIHRNRLTTDLVDGRTVAQQQLQLGLKEEAAQKDRLLELGRVRAGAETLERDVKAAQVSYDQLLAALQQTGLQAQSKVGDASVLEKATAPTQPSYPKRKLFALASLLVGLALACAAVLARELLDPRVRAKDHLMQLSEASLAFSIPRFSAERTPLLAKNRALLGAAKAQR